jgi:ketosteroid isomerase-like protein
MSAEELARLEQDFMTAVQKRDMGFLEDHIAEEFILITGRTGAQTRGREEWLEITREQYVIEDFSFDGLEVVELGDAAVVRSRYSQKGRMGDQDRSHAYLMSDTWARRDARWQLIHRHITPLEV